MVQPSRSVQPEPSGSVCTMRPICRMLRADGHRLRRRTGLTATMRRRLHHSTPSYQ